MCCWVYEDVFLEEAPKKKEKPKDENTYILMSSELPKSEEKPVETPVSRISLFTSLTPCDCYMYSNIVLPHPFTFPICEQFMTQENQHFPPCVCNSES